MILSLVAAVGNNRVIGKDNAMPWHMPADLKYFKRITLGKPVIMGRRTFESIGRPLPGRTNIIISRDPDYRNPDCVVVRSIEQALAAARAAAPGAPPLTYREELMPREAGRREGPAALVHLYTSEEVMVIGGAALFEQLLPSADRIYLTEIKGDFPGDRYFPALPADTWREQERQDHPADADNPYPYSFVVLTRATAAAPGPERIGSNTD